MSIQITCPKCDKQLAVNEKAIGRKVRCPACETIIRVPEVPPPREGEEAAEKIIEVGRAAASLLNRAGKAGAAFASKKAEAARERKEQERVTRETYLENVGSVASTDHDNLRVLDSASTENVTVEVLEYETLGGSASTVAAQQIFYANQAGIRLKQVRIRLQKGGVTIEPGCLHYMKGRLELISSSGGVMKAVSRKMLSGETLFQSRIEGTGEVYLEPTFGHFFLLPMDSQALIVDKGLFYAGTDGITVTARMQRNISSALFGGEGLFQTEVDGHGIAVLACPVPLDEVRCFELRDEKLSVDGDFALMRTKGIEFRAEKSSKSLIGTLTSGEGLLQTFTGTGRVWIAPTQSIYSSLAVRGGVQAHSGHEGRSHTDT